MNFKIVPHFEEIFPEENKENPLFYLLKIPKELLLKSIGFCNTYPLPTYNNFFSDKEIAKNIAKRIGIFKRGSDKDIEIISPHSYLKLSELILSNIEKFTMDGDKSSNSELNLFKAFLVLNSRFTEYNHDFQTNQNKESFINFIVLQGFQLSEISMFEDDKNEFVKLIYATIYKVESLLKFLSNKDLELTKAEFIKSYGLNSEEDFLYNMKYFFATLFIAKLNNQFIFTSQNLSCFDLIKNIAATKITEDEDFTELKKTPIYFIDENRFSIVNFYFAVDLFYRSAKFRLQEIFKDNEIKIENFFSFYNKEFSENFLMKNLLDTIFSKKFYTKKIEYESEEKNEPDYYLNYNNTLLIFENKDVLISKSIKSANDIETIENFLKERFLQSKKKGVGIKQLVNSIEFIYNQNFKFDNTIKYNHKIEIFPILLVHDRVFESMGINYKLNNWFIEELHLRNIKCNEKFKIHSLTLMDIDTLILWNHNIKDNFKILKDLLIAHTKQLNELPKKSYNNPKHFTDYLQRLLRPISARETPFFIKPGEFSKQFLDLLSNKNR